MAYVLAREGLLGVSVRLPPRVLLPVVVWVLPLTEAMLQAALLWIV